MLDMVCLGNFLSQAMRLDVCPAEGFLSLVTIWLVECVRSLRIRLDMATPYCDSIWLTYTLLTEIYSMWILHSRRNIDIVSLGPSIFIVISIALTLSSCGS